MAGLSLLALLDDISTILDDVALMTKVAAQKTVGVVGDDLALNAQQVVGVRAERELPVIWRVAVGSLVNKAILIPAALAISAVWPGLIVPLLMVGGSYLCYEGAEKLLHWLRPGKKAPETGAAPDEAGASPAPMSPEVEKAKIKGAIRTDFVLSAEIIVIALGTVPASASFPVRAGVLMVVGLLMTIGVYGVVAGIVKLDDLGLWLLRRGGTRGWRRRAGLMLIGAAPWLMRVLAVAGTAAMFLVGGGILVHGLPFLTGTTEWLAARPVAWLLVAAFRVAVGLVVGGVLIGLFHLGARWVAGRRQS